MNKRFYITIGLLFLLLGAFLGSPWLNQYLRDKGAQPVFTPSTVQAATPPPSHLDTPEFISGTPNHISFPAVNVSVDVEKGYYNPATKAWSLSNTKAEYAAVTPEPNNKSGNTFIYGHNRPNVFANLLKVKVGDKAIVTTSNGHTFTYELVSMRDTSPQDTSLFNYQGKPIMTVQTCSGAWFQNRRLLTYNLVEAH